jgi:hypothetical protein
VDDDHGVFFPGLTGGFIPDTTPQINHFFSAVINAAGCSQFITEPEIIGEYALDCFKPWLDRPVNGRGIIFVLHFSLLKN